MDDNLFAEQVISLLLEVCVQVMENITPANMV